MSDQLTADERERTYRRIRRFYKIAADREWNRLDQPIDGRLEFEVHKAWISRFLPPPPARILDIGGGPGRYAIWLAGMGYRVTLADLSPDLLEVGRARAKEAEVELEGIVEANAVDLAAFDGASFDAALCLGPMYHIMPDADREAAARELHRVLKTGAAVFAAFLNRLQVLRVAVNQDIPLFTPYTFEMVKKWYAGVLDFPISGTFNLAYLYHPADIAPFMEKAGFQTLELVSSQSIAGDVQRHLALFAERQPDLYPWVMRELIELANEPTILGSGFHILYIGNKP